ncbi:MAG: hypothetical protein KDL09_00555 [Prosthecobacter sp.]|nr:hypothetical protein [Prosthecobacter sp.]
MEDQFTFPGARLVEYPDSFPRMQWVFDIPEIFSPTAKFFDVDGLPVVWDIEGSPPIPLLPTKGGTLVSSPGLGTSVLNEGVVIDEATFRQMINAGPRLV